MSAEVGELREEVVARLKQPLTPNPSPLSGERGEECTPSPLPTGEGEELPGLALDWLMQACQAGEHAASQALKYIEAQHAATGMVPTQKRLLFERFFDESGGMQLVIHAPFGTRINRAWGLAMRKRFCRTFDFELQAAADDNGIVLSLGTQHSFPLEQMFTLTPSHVARDVIVQAFLAVPYFPTRWRWNATRALQLKRSRNGQRVPPHLQRIWADDLLSSVFPAQTACKEHLTGDIELPDHPLVRQSMEDCLQEASDLSGLMNVLRDLEEGKIETVGLDSREPSPFAHALLNANPYAFLDDAPLEERRARAVTMRRTLSVESLRDLGRLDPEAIAQVTSDAWPTVRDADELHDVLLSMAALPIADGQEWAFHFEELLQSGRASVAETPQGGRFWIATERVPLIKSIWPEVRAKPDVTAPAGVRQEWPREEAILYLIRGRVECCGPTTIEAMAALFRLHPSDVEAALIGLENEGVVLRGRFTGNAELEWCERRLLARIHRLTLEGLRRQIAPVPVEQFMRFLVRHQHLHSQSKLRGQAGLQSLIEQLEGFEAPAGHWEQALLASRMEGYNATWLDALTFFGQAAWGRLRPPASLSLWRLAENENMIGNGRPMKALTRSTPITLMLREHVSWLLPLGEDGPDIEGLALGSNARAAYEAFQSHGALFPNQLGALLHLVPAQVDDVLGELAAAGLVTSDGYPALRTLLGTATQHSRNGRRRHASPHHAGRWTLLRSALTPSASSEERVAQWCRLLLRRYGVMFRDLLANESAAPTWGELVRVYRRMEARGEIRGGRFVADVGGEQYALGETIPMLRCTPNDGNEPALELSATDPMNLSGRIGGGQRVPALPGYVVRVANGRVESVTDHADQAMHPPTCAMTS